MNRRDFMKLAGAVGLTVAAPTALTSSLNAAEDTPYEGPLFLMVHAGGGWDPTSLCDPKGRANEEEEKPVNMYFKDEIGEAGNIRYAPFGNNKEFFDRFHSQMTVINGIDTATNGHDSGTRHMWSGNLAEGHPSLAAMIAAAHAPNKPMGFITNGGYDETRGIVSRTRIGDINALKAIAFPNRIDDDENFHTPETFSRIQAAQQGRLAAMREKIILPHTHKTISTLEIARGGNNELRRLTEFLPEINGSSLARQAKVAIAAFKAGLCVSANLSSGGFDTHGDHDRRQGDALSRLLGGIMEIWDEVERQQVGDKVVIVVTSDFGRTPYYNSNNGKDHWSVTSMIAMGAGIPGNRVIGSSTDGFRPNKVNPDTLKEDEDGVRITPAHIHKQLRKLAGLGDTRLNGQFALTAEDMALFG